MCTLVAPSLGLLVYWVYCTLVQYCTVVYYLLFPPSPSQTEDLHPLSKATSHQKRKNCPENDFFLHFFLSGEGNPGIFVIFIFNFTTVIFFSTVGFILGLASGYSLQNKICICYFFPAVMFGPLP